MYLYTLPLYLGILLVIEYLFVFKKNIANPSIIFNAGFFLCALFLTYFDETWKVTMHQETFFLVLGGNIAFFLGSYIGYRRYYTNPLIGRSRYKWKSQNENFFVPIITNRLKILFILQVLNAGIKVYLLMSFYGLGSIAANLFAHTEAMKTGEGELMKFPMGLGFISNTIDIAATLTPILLGLYIVKKRVYKSQYRWLFINFLAGAIFSLLSSGRTFMLYFIISFFVSYIMTLVSISKNVSIKNYVMYFLVGYIFLYSFQEVGRLIGRQDSESTPIEQTIGTYCGAELQNLDNLIERPSMMPSPKHWAEQTFNIVYSGLEEMGYINSVSSLRDYHPFQVANGYGIGNVASCMQSYYFDFGLFGAYFVCFVLGFLMQVMYIKAQYNNNFFSSGVLTISIILYGLFCPAIFMSFFSEQIVQRIITFISIKYWFKIFLIFIFFYGGTPKRINNLIRKYAKNKINSNVSTSISLHT